MQRFEQVSQKISFPELERGILGFWSEHDVFARSIELRKDDPLWVFYEGPPTANGRPGIHHVWARLFSAAMRSLAHRGQTKPPCQRRSNKNAAQFASSGNASWNSVSDRALAIGCPAMATNRQLIRGRLPYLDHPGTTG